MAEKEKEEPKPNYATAGRNSPSPVPRAAEKAPEPKRDDEGRVMIAPVSVATSHIPHEVDPEAEEEVEEECFDETVPGGRYQVGNKIVNANGEILEDAPAPKKAAKK